jgi:hypothetical protein
MASYTNVRIPDFGSYWRTLQRRILELELALKEVTAERDSVAREMENIISAVREWGYVDLETEDGKTCIRLIEKPEERHEQGE